MKKVSFVIPAYNVENVVCKCIQTIMTISGIEYEIIVVDDGSTDSTLEKLSNIRSSKLKVIHQSNQGVSAARNCGIKNADGEYIAFVDADDLIVPNRFFEIIKNIDSQYDFVMFGYEMVFKDHIECQSLPLKQGIYGQLDGKVLCERLYDSPFSKNYKSNYIGGKVYQYLFKKEFLDSNNIYFKQGIHFAEDCLFCLSCFINVKAFKIVEDILYQYIVYDSSASHKYRENFWQELVESFHCGCEIYGKEFKNKSETLFYYGDEVIYRTVLFGMKNGVHLKAIKRINKMLQNDDFQFAIRSMNFDNWTLKERLIIFLCKSKIAFGLYILHVLIIWLKRILNYDKRK